MKNTINTKTLTVSLPIGFQMVLEEWIDSQTQHRDEAIYALLAHGLHAVRTIPTTSNDYEGRRSGRSSDTGMVWYVMVFYGMVWYGMVWYGMVWYGMVILGGVRSTEYLMKPLRVRHTLRCNLMFSRPPEGDRVVRAAPEALRWQ